MAPGSPKRPRFTKVNARFYADDVKELRALATAAGIPWQVFLRETVHRAIPEAKTLLTAVRESAPKGVIR